MRKFLQSFTLLLFVSGLLGGLPAAYASHLLGCDMTYTSLGANQYRVKFRLYRDCSGITASPFTLEARNGGCSSPASLSVPLVAQGAPIAATPLCPSNTATCSNPTGAYPLFDFANYEATVTLPPGQWILSTSQGSRPDIGNLATVADLYAEAKLDNRGTNVFNTSPQFDPQDIPIQYVCVNQLSTFGFSATEPDGDSLVYSLATPLSGCNQPIPYKPYPGAAGGVVILTRVPLCVLEFTGLAGGSTYTPLLPLPVATDTTGVCPIKTGVPKFTLNQSARTVTFRPNRYVPNVAAGNGDNKYQVVIKVDEYRRVNGVRRIVGSVRREAVLIVIDCGTNSTPNTPRVTSQTTGSNTGTLNTADTTEIKIYSCNYSRVKINFTDPDNLRTPSANQNLTVTLPATINTDPSYLDSGDVGSFFLAGNGTTNPQGTFFFQPSPSAVGRVIRINVRIEDNACPVKGLQNRVIVIRILKGNFASAAAAVGGTNTLGETAICQGGEVQLVGSVVRPDSIRRLSNNTTQAQVYTYQWYTKTVAGAEQTIATTQTLTVSPTASTRYRLRIIPTLGFAQGACEDTTSILVRVVAPPVARLVTNNAYICPGGTATLLASATTSGGSAQAYTYRFAPANGLATADQNSANPTVRPTVTTRYRVTVTGATPTSCTDTTSVLVRVLPGIVSNFTARDSVGLNGQRTNRPPVVFTFNNTSAVTGAVPGATTKYVWTYQRVKDASGMSVTEAPVVFGGNAATPTPLQLGISGSYIIKLTTTVSILNGTTTTACTPTSKQITVIVPDVQVPNIITPNGDGKNDYFQISTANTQSKLEIYNRWGRKVYETSEYKNNWNGEGQASGVYYYLLTDRNGAQTKGWLEVVRNN